jgi:transcriptional regulator with XRE-family HTH domain
MKTFGQVITEARKKAGLTQKEVGERLCREDGRKVLPPYLNDLEHDRRYPSENEVTEQLAKILNLSADVLYFYAKRVPADVSRDGDDSEVGAAYRAFRRAFDEARKDRSRSRRERSSHASADVQYLWRPRFLGKNRTPDRTPQGGCGKKARIS